jgi:adenosylcobalamin-dependent ribonucleoside-triphosphate reductase
MTPSAYTPSIRAQILTRRTYNRPLDEAGTSFETWDMTIDRVITHQRWLWERARGKKLAAVQVAELAELRTFMIDRRALPSGRTLWLGGTEIVKRREASNFNCAFAKVQDVHDLVDLFWLLLQGAGTGFMPVNGTLAGFSRKMAVEVVRSARTEKGGRADNRETFDEKSGTWTITVGDSAEAWAKAAGKLVVGKFPASKLIVDMSEIRPEGARLKGYGWICSGDAMLSVAFAAIANIRNKRAGKLLTKIDLLDIVNHLGTVLSTRRSAEACLMNYGDPEWEAFATAKPKGYHIDNPQRGMSNNGLMFWDKPTTREISRLFGMMVDHGGSEPSFNNAAEARRRAPWFDGYNPCFEILLPNHGFCNLSELNIARFTDDEQAMHRAAWLLSRCNYRQTLVNLKDGILQASWHENNEYLRLCGFGITGIVGRPDFDRHAYKQLRNTAISGAYSMADELGTERPKNVTTVKPSGTLGKVMDATEGAHAPLGRYIFNNVAFSKHDKLIPILAHANYRVFDHPTDPSAVLVALPVSWPNVPFTTVRGTPVNVESAIDQLERYRRLQAEWNDQNTSVTVSYDPSEVPAMVKWFDRHWDSYVGVSFLFRNDPTKTAADLGHAYLPQEVVTKQAFDEYSAGLKHVDIDAMGGDLIEDDCATGSCPMR